MPNGRIIKPQGRVVKRITIEMDAAGQATLKAEDLSFIGTGIGARPMAARQVALVLSQVLTNAIVAALMGSTVIDAAAKEAPDEEEKPDAS